LAGSTAFASAPHSHSAQAQFADKSLKKRYLLPDTRVSTHATNWLFRGRFPALYVCVATLN
jgi:hypothetical protein